MNVRFGPIDHISVVLGDIFQSDCTCIVNPVNSPQLREDDFEESVLSVAGPELLEACRKAKRFKRGRAILTDGYGLKAKYVIHTVGMGYPTKESEDFYKKTYHHILDAAKNHSISSIALIDIFTASTAQTDSDTYSKTTHIAVQSVREWMQENKDYQIDVAFYCMDSARYDYYCEYIGEMKRNSRSSDRFDQPLFEISGGILFHYNGNQSAVAIPDHVQEIGICAFKDCKFLTRVLIPKGVRAIGKKSFSGCASMTKIMIPDGMERIGADAFSECVSLQSITIPDSVISLGAGAFRHCVSLKSVRIPSRVERIGDGLFEECQSLNDVEMPENAVGIGNAAFRGCLSLEKVIIPKTVKHIGVSAFTACQSLQSVTVPEGVSGLAQTFAECTSLESVVLPDSITEIDSGAFYGCQSLSEITIPNHVTRIGAEAFEGCLSIKEMTIPYSVKYIDYAAFRNCASLKSVTSAHKKSLIYVSPYNHEDETYIGMVSDDVIRIRGFVFENCPLLTICAPVGSGLIEFAGRMGIPFREIAEDTSLQTD